MEILQAVTEAEAQAAEIKRAAQEERERILADARARAASKENALEENLKTLRERTLENARTEADEAYAQSLAQTKQEAENYCEKILRERGELAVTNIVGRIVRGSR